MPFARFPLLLVLASALACLPAALAFGRDAISSLDRGPSGWTFHNRLSGDSALLSAAAPVFDCDGALLGGASAGEAKWKRTRGGQVERWTGEWRVTSPRAATIRVAMTLDPATGLLHKWAELILADGPPALVRSVTLDEITAAGQAFTRWPGTQSYPALGKSFFFGIEFPYDTSQVNGDTVTLRHAPGKRATAGQPFRSRNAVYGVARTGETRRAFEAYISALRPQPTGVHFNYNSWWTSPVPYTEADILKLIGEFRTHLYAPYGVSPDSFTIDMGWAKNTTLWQIDPALFPQGFANLERACRDINSDLGLWISPSGMYGQALDLAWAKSAGYEADTKACLGGPKYQAAFKQSLLDIIQRSGLRQVKFDGYVATCDAKDHGHEPGALSAEPIAEGIIDIFQAVHKAAPNLWMEPTCFGYDPSPWWLMYCQSVIGTFGDDAPRGRVPCPTYRESYTTARDYSNLKGARDVLAPIAAQEVLGVVHQTPEPLQNDAVVTVMRGHQFLPLYLNPRYMDARRWEFLAALMKYARRNQDVLSQTRPILPQSWVVAGGGPNMWQDVPAAREPHGYGHWAAASRLATDGAPRGIVCLRNPWIEPTTVTVRPVADLGAPAEGADLCAVQVYPRRCTLAPHIKPVDAVRVRLAPYETVVIEFAAPGASPLPPAPARRLRPVVKLAVAASRCETAETGPAYGKDFTRLWFGAGPHLRLHVNGTVRTRSADAHELLLLVEAPGPIGPPVLSFTVNGQPVQCRRINSEQGWCATGAAPPEHWLWVVVPLHQGENRVEGSITLAEGTGKVTGWVAARETIPWERLKTVDGASLPSPEERFTAAVRAFPPCTMTADLPLEQATEPVVRINGVYLDTLEPVSVTQGYGTLQRNQSVWEKPMTIGGERYFRGLGTHSPARIVYDLGGKYKRFQAWAGADQATGPTITMEVRVDGRSVWHTGLLTRESPAQRVDLNVTGAKKLELLVGDGGNGIGADHADWADAMLLF